jgi:hypothetical protein
LCAGNDFSFRAESIAGVFTMAELLKTVESSRTSSGRSSSEITIGLDAFLPGVHEVARSRSLQVSDEYRLTDAMYVFLLLLEILIGEPHRALDFSCFFIDFNEAFEVAFNSLGFTGSCCKKPSIEV